MSLKTALVKEISQLKGKVFSYTHLENFCHIWGYKVSNAERRLRESPEVEPVRNQKGYIVGYRSTEAETQATLF